MKNQEIKDSPKNKENDNIKNEKRDVGKTIYPLFLSVLDRVIKGGGWSTAVLSDGGVSRTTGSSVGGDVNNTAGAIYF